jgi:acetyl esterase/lipase
METHTSTDITRRLDPALRQFAAARTDLSLEALPVVRESLNRRRRQAADGLDIGYLTVDDDAVRDDRGHLIPIRIYRANTRCAPVVLYCHSGAFVLGNLDTDHRQCVELSLRVHCTVVSVDYRLAPEHPHPTGLEDALTVLRWIAANAGALDVDVARLAVAGSSAGGGLAALLAQHVADGTAPPAICQLLHQPVLDDSPTPSKQEFTTTPGMHGPATRQMWEHLCAEEPAPTDAVAARRDDLSGLPSALVTCSELDPLRDEAIGYAHRLLRCGVPTELHVFPGTCHGFDSMMPEWEVSQQLFALQASALRRALRPQR